MNFANLWESETFSTLVNRIVDVPVAVARNKCGGVETEVQTRPARPRSLSQNASEVVVDNGLASESTKVSTPPSIP